jgi:hypothetical protein
MFFNTRKRLIHSTYQVFWISHKSTYYRNMYPFPFCRLCNSAFSIETIWLRMVGWINVEQLLKFGMKSYEYYPNFCLEGLRKITKPNLRKLDSKSTFKANSSCTEFYSLTSRPTGLFSFWSLFLCSFILFVDCVFKAGIKMICWGNAQLNLGTLKGDGVV